jgi:Trk K+ transport system NAD-binding subunit
VLLEGTVSSGSSLDGKRVRDARLPPGCLLVSIDRAGEEILPNGETVLAAGDKIVALVDGRRARRVREALHDLLEVRRTTT